jgi:hypothetical protein
LRAEHELDRLRARSSSYPPRAFEPSDLHEADDRQDRVEDDHRTERERQVVDDEDERGHHVDGVEPEGVALHQRDEDEGGAEPGDRVDVHGGDDARSPDAAPEHFVPISNTLERDLATAPASARAGVQR